MSRRKSEGAVSVDAGALAARTEPIARTGGRPLLARVEDAALLDGAADLLAFVLRYVEDTGAELKDGETFQYGYWSLRFTPEADVLALWERDDDYAEFVPGTDRAVRAWRSQWETCAELGSAFDPPRADGIAVAAKDLFTASRLDAVRYEPGENTNGWWFLTDSYTGESDQVVPQHLYHVTAAYPELTRFLALDVGWVAHWDGGRITPYREAGGTAH